MNIEQLTKQFGEEYPAAIVHNGTRMPLSRETRFCRRYCLAARKDEVFISRFMDGSASITIDELRREWPSWTDSVRLDFCNECSWLHGQSDFPDMLRFIMQQGGADEWRAVALCVGSSLPQVEAFDTLLRVLYTMKIGETGNIVQGIAKTKHPDAEPTLRRHLQSLWSHPLLWDDDHFLNWVAHEAMTCIVHLIELGAPTDDFVEHVRQLSQHRCSGNRDACHLRLSEHYSWLK